MNENIIQKRKVILHNFFVKHMFLITFMSILFWGLSVCRASFHTVEKIGPVQADASHVVVRSIPDNKMDVFRKQKDFIYKEPQEGITWWERLKVWIWTKIIEFLAIDENEFSFNTLYFYLIAAFIIIVMIAVLFKLDLRSIFYTRKKITMPQVLDNDENIHDINMDQLLQHYITHNDFRGAVRILYKKSLKELSDQKIIHWKENKTNREYIREVADIELQRIFKDITGLFEYVWYGHLALDSRSFHQVKTYFSDFYDLVVKRV